MQVLYQTLIYVQVNLKLGIMSGISRNATYLTKINIQKYKATTKQKQKQNKTQKNYRHINYARTGWNIKYVWTRLSITHFKRKKN